MDPAHAAHQRFLQCRYFDSLDGLRGLSILAVIWHHSGVHAGGILSKGHLGVAFFFAISGLLITTLLLREQARTGTVSLPAFYLRRTLRIFPLYYAVIALYVLLVTLLERGTPAGAAFFENLPAYLTYTSNWFVDLSGGNRVIFYFAWSLATEEQFYLLWPSVVRYARTWYVPPAFMAALALLGEGGRLAVEGGWVSPEPLLVRIVLGVATPICLGCLAAYLLHRPGGFRLAWRVAGQAWSAPLAALLLGLTLASDASPTALVAAAMTLLIVTCSIRPDHLLRRLLEHRALRWVGTISYGMYLLHMLALNAVRRLAPESGVWVRFALGASLAILLASITYRWFEHPILSLKDRLMGRAPPLAAPAQVG